MSSSSSTQENLKIIERFIVLLDKKLNSKDLSGTKVLLEKLTPIDLSLPIFKKRHAAYEFYRGNLNVAEKLYRDLIIELPNDQFNYVNAFKTLIKLGNINEGLVIASMAATRFSGDITLVLELLRLLFAHGHYEALYRFTNELKRNQFPEDFDLLWLRANALLHGHLQDNGEMDFERCLLLAKQDRKEKVADILMSLVQVCYRNGRDEKLKTILPIAYENRHEKLSHYLTLLDYLEKTGDLRSMGKLLNESLEKFPASVEIKLFKVVYLRRTGCSEELAKHFESFDVDDSSPCDMQIKMHHEKARFFELQNDYRCAFKHYEEMNRLVLQKQGGLEANTQLCHIKDKILDDWKNLIPSMAEKYHNQDKHNMSGGPIFFVGFPRSGTTLVDQILTSHPSIEVIEEKPVLRQVIDRIEKLHGAYPSLGLLTMAEQEKINYRRIYESAQDYFCKTNRPVVVNKLPLNIIQLPLILELFPNARILVAIRHPMDSVLSCFFQHFEHNTAMANFLTLEGSVSFYQKVMSNFMMVKDLYQHDFICVFRYEDVVNDLQTEAAKILSFLDLPWNDAVLNFHETALKRTIINTPSYTQVTQPLYKSSVYKWINYEEEVKRHLHSLGIFIRAFGYQ